MTQKQVVRFLIHITPHRVNIINPGVKLLKTCIGNKDKENKKEGKDSVDVSLHQIVWRPIVGCDKPRQIAAQ